ncbi:MAG: PriCT-2 domain-containing protein, partial [Caldimonas sp.]
MTLIPLSRDAALVLGWHLSDPVPVLQRPERPPRSAGAVVGHDELQALLCAIPNRGPDELDYDEWWRVVAGIHEVTSGSDAGLELAHTFSAKSSKYAPAFLDERVWPFIRSEGRGQVVGLGSLQRIAARYGWQAVPVDADVFDDVSELDPRPPMAGSGGSAPDSGGSAPDSGGVDLTSIAAVNATALSSAVLVSRATVNAPVRRGIPEAHHLTTDQANANRIVRAFGRQVFVAAGRWHVWDGRRWLADESDVYRYGCQLSDLIRVEAIEVKARASVLDAAEQKKAAGIAEALMKWAVRSEMKATIESAIGLARKMLTVEADMLDRDPFALNCLNGVVDLRTGALRRHNPDELITKLVPVAY